MLLVGSHSQISNLKPPTTVMLYFVSKLSSLVVILAVSAPLSVSVAGSFIGTEVHCASTAECENYLRVGSECVEGLCTNPFAEGCLRRLLGKEKYPNKRACNSNDLAESTLCERAPFNYEEIRVAPGDWESSMFYGWIIQILLSEALDVPVSLETSGAGGMDFYDISGAWNTPKEAYPFESIREGNRVGDCRLSKNFCAHVLPEIWSPQEAAWKQAEDDRYILSVEGNGMVGKLFWGIPAFLAKDDPSLLSHFGLSNQRHKLAKVFKRPVTWQEYCEEVSLTRCEIPDQFAQRVPLDSKEETKYFVRGLYTGYFRATEKNNCTLNPDTCTGHIVIGPCDWDSNMDAQLYWNNISLESDGKLMPNRGYTHEEMVDIYYAANATQSAVMTWYWRPTTEVQIFSGSAYEFQQITLPMVTEECLSARISNEERCSDDANVRRGTTAVGACDDEHHTLQKAMARSLYESTMNAPAATRSPGFETLNALRISDFSMDSILKQWAEKGFERNSFDARDAVCSWVAANIDELKRFFPEGYPREIYDGGRLYKVGYLYGALAAGAFVTLLVVVAGAATYYWRKRKVMVYAQIPFLFLILMGFLLVSVGAIIFVFEPSDAFCVTRQWLVTLGYTFGLVPLLVKIAAINKFLQGAKRMKRVKLSPVRLLIIVALCIFAVVAYLIVWTVVGESQAVEKRLLDVGGRVVEVTIDCVSSSDAWMIVAYGWEILLLLCATVLAFQTRGLKEEFSESRCVGNLVYSHFVFLILRGATYLSPAIKPNVRAGVTSFLLSFDTLLALIIYFTPKFSAAAAAAAKRDYVTNAATQRKKASPRNPHWSEVVSSNNDAVRTKEESVDESAIYLEPVVLSSRLPPLMEVSEKSSESSDRSWELSGSCQPWAEGLGSLEF